MIEQFDGPEAIDQLTPVPAGNGSSMTTPVAVPVPAATLLDAVTVKPICEPALTEGASQVFDSDRFGHSTLVEAPAVCIGEFVAVRDAVLA